MIDFVIWVSVGIFFLLPYYLVVFIAEKKHIKRHIYMWLVFHAVFMVGFLAVDGIGVNVPSMLLIVYTLYYAGTYFFHVRKVIEDRKDYDFFYTGIGSSVFRKVKASILSSCSVLFLADIALSLKYMYEKQFDFSLLYIDFIVAISYIQTVVYIKRWSNKRKLGDFYPVRHDE